MRTYQTAEVAKIIGIHPNTVRLYEELELIPAVSRQDNQYRIFTDRHIAHFKLARLALQVEILQNGLRKKIVEMVKVSASGDYDRAVILTNEYLNQVRQEQKNALEAIDIVRQLLSGNTAGPASLRLKRREVSDLLHISMDTLRNWEMNGLLSVNRKENGYRIYTEEDIRRLKIIRSLRCANYSLEAILRLMQELSANPGADIRKVLNTPTSNDDIISVCDKLVVSLQNAEQNAKTMLWMLRDMKNRYS